jgi:pyruvate dehydrogenase E2 component (dihydrolipoamide acetyltransferase)
LAIQEIHVPDIGGSTSVDVIEILVKVGDTVDVDTSLLTLESDKATMEVPSPFAGKITGIKVTKGNKIAEGDLIFLLDNLLAASAAAPTVEAVAEVEQTQTVVVPDMGGAKSVDVIEIHVKPGDVVNIDDSLITLESDKATMEVPSPFAGVIEKLEIKLADKLTEGAVILQMKIKGASKPVAQASSTAPVAPAKTTSAPVASKTSPAPQKVSGDFANYDRDIAEKNKAAHIYAGPSVRRLAQEFGVDLSRVKGSGRKDRILPEDVQLYVKARLRDGGGDSSSAGLNLLPWPIVDFKKFGEIETKPLNKIKKITAANLHRNWVMMPHVTQFDEADITELEAYRQANKAEAEKNGYKLTPIIFIIKAIVSALKTYPNFNASLDESGENLILKKYFNVGVAVDTPNGLVVPVLRSADTKTIGELAIELATISKKAREKGLSPQEMQGGNFAISSLGGIGGTAFTPIINAPDVAILGVSKSQMKPVYVDGKFEPRLMLPLCLSYDHRVIDGADGARFITHLKDCLSDLKKLV